MELKDVKINVGQELLSDFRSWRPDYALLADLSRTRTQTVANPSQVWQLCQDVAKAIGFDAQVVAAVLALEYDFPKRQLYRANATRDDGSPRYRGITQASQGFWTDVVGHARGKGFNIRASRPENATLFEQIAAPFVYLDRYRKSVSGHLVTPAMIYALHQQGPGEATRGFRNIAGSQSKRSIAVVEIATNGARGRQMDYWL